MAQWVVRIGNIKSINYAVKHGFVGIGWHEMGDLTKCKDGDSFYTRYISCTDYLDRSRRLATRHTNQIRSFFFGINNGDTVYLPITSTKKLHEGRVLGSPFFLGNPEHIYITHVRKVVWERELFRDELDEAVIEKLKYRSTVIHLS